MVLVMDPLARLDVEHREATEQLASLRRDFDGIVAASADSNADDEHDPEGSTIAFERSQIGALIDQAAQRLGGDRRSTQSRRCADIRRV